MSSRIVAGTLYGGRLVSRVDMFKGPQLFITKGMKRYDLNKSTLACYNVIDRNDSKSLGKAALYGLTGAALFGPLGLLGGVAMSGNKSTLVVSFELYSGDNALIEMDRQTYQQVVRALY